MSFRARVGIVVFLLGGSLLACKPQPAVPAVSADHPPSVPFELRSGAENPDVTLFWLDEQANAHVATRVDEIPPARRALVRVDPVRPEARPAGWVFVADVRQPTPDGHFAVRALTSEQFARELRPEPTPPPVQPPPNPALNPTVAQNNHGAPSPQGQPRVIIYGASWCSACHQAAEWLRSQNIPFVEHDIEREADVAASLAERARQQGVPIGSIPIIEVGGRLMVGFNPVAISRALQTT